MGAGRTTRTITLQEKTPCSTVPENGCFSARNLFWKDLRGVVFGCTHETMAECLSKHLFGLPHGHYSYVKNIRVGLPLFLFNYSDRKLHGIYEATSQGGWNLNSSAWTAGSSQSSPFPAQVRIRTRIQCHALSENQFKKIIQKNYYTPHHFWFELDNSQTTDLLAAFRSVHPSASRLSPAASRGDGVFPVLPTTKYVQQSRKELPQRLPATSWKEVVRQGSQDLRKVKTCESINQYTLLSDDGDSQHQSPTKMSSLENKECKEPVSDWEELEVDDSQSSSVTGSQSEIMNSDSEELEYVNEALEDEAKRMPLILENMAGDAKFAPLPSDDRDSEQHSSVKLSLNILEGIESKEPVSDWEELIVDSLPSSSSDGTRSSAVDINSDELKYVDEATENEANRMPYRLENLAADESHSNSRDDGQIPYKVVQCASGCTCENSGNVSVASCGNGQSVKIALASQFNGISEAMGCSGSSCCTCGSFELVKIISNLLSWTLVLKNHQVESDREIQQLRNQLWHSERKIGMLEDRFKELESKTNPSKLADESLDRFVQQHFGSEDVIYLIGGFDGCSHLSALDSFSPLLDITTPLQSMNSPRSYASAVALDGNLFVFGGCSGTLWFDTVECYNRRHDQWIPCPSMLCKKGNPSGATIDGRIFAIGGGDGREYLSDVETFDPSKGKWFLNQPMLYKRFASAASVHKGAIYALGGYDGNGYLRSAERFDPREGRWTELPSMSTRRGSHASAVLNDKLYCIGGFNGQRMVSSVEIYEPRTSSWTTGKPMNLVRGCFSAVVLGDKIYSVGGIGDDKKSVDVVECYQEGAGWSGSGWRGIGKRSCFSAVVL